MPSPNSEAFISDDDVKTIVERAFNSRTKFSKYELRPYSKYVIGVLGAHRNLEITVRRSNSIELEKHTFFAKLVPQESTIQSLFVKQNGFFKQESKFYNEVMPRLLESYTAEPWAPECYLANEDIIVLEDVRQKGFTMRDSANKIFEGKFLRSAARALARMHASSILAEEKLGKSLKEIYPEACIEQMYSQHLKDHGLLDLLVNLAENIAQDHGRNYEVIAPAFESVYEGIQNCRGKNRVILHGDTWPNNFMFDSEDSSKCLVLDFQVTRYANRMFDITQLVYCSTTPAIRIKEEVGVIEAYHDEFNKVVRNHDSSVKLPSLSETLQEYEDARLHGLLCTMFYYPAMLVSKEEYLSYGDDPEAIYNKFIFRKNNDAVLGLMKRDQEYARRLTESALELVEYCEKL